MKTKVCSKCGKELPATKEYFHAKKDGKYGLSSYCKNCQKKRYKKYREENKEKLKEYDKKYREENKEKIKRYYEENKEAIKEYNKKYNKKYYEENKEVIKEYKKKYREENKEKLKEYDKKYTNELRDWYIVNLLTKDSTLTSEDIKQYPELIELKKQEILLKREFNTSPNHDK